MIIFKEQKELKKHLTKLNNSLIGFVPTMGALHQGHISLIKESNKTCNITICSIYVNPTQFNNTDDLLNYPKTIKDDIKILQESGCDILYCPENTDLYVANEKANKYRFNGVELYLEGEHRPGHFDGVATIIEKLFKIFTPNNAYFGEKDFQQLLLIKTLAEHLNLKTNVIGCKTIRESDGLAMSSRNSLMTNNERESASEIIKLLIRAKEMYSEFNVLDIKSEIEKKSESIDSFILEYFEIMNLSEFSNISITDNETRAFIACKVGKVRLIDNITL